MKIPIKKIEEILNVKVKKHIISQGFDIAERMGYCKIVTTERDVIFDWSFIEFDKTDVKNVYKQMIETFEQIINQNAIVVIEDTHLQFIFSKGKMIPLADVFKKLTRFGSFALSATVRKKCPEWYLIQAVSARAKLKINTRGYGRGNSKLAVADWLKDKLEIELDDNDISDSIVLAILGIIEGMDFTAITKKKRKTRKKK